MVADAFRASAQSGIRWAFPKLFAVRRLLLAVGVVAVVALEIALIWGLGNTGDHFDPQCMQPGAACSR
jgi:hypothetical protein